MNVNEVCEAVERFKSLKVLVIGDVILDAYYRGDVRRISPEAPVPVLEVTSKEYRLGGAANVALNVKELGAQAIICSVIGDDEAAASIEQMMQSEALSTKGLVKSSDRVTSKKTRLVSGFSQMTRFDEEMTTPLHQNDESRLTTLVSGLMQSEQPDAIVFQDYDKGALTPTLIHSIIQQAKSANIKITVDPKKRNFFAYAGATMFKPNLKELRDGLNIAEIKANKDSLEVAFKKLCDKMPVDIGFFTLSADGVFITNGSSSHHVPAMKRNIADVSGAGDTVIAAATCALAVGLEMHDIARISNLAGGWVCQFPGVVSVHKDQLIEEIRKAF